MKVQISFATIFIAALNKPKYSNENINWRTPGIAASVGPQCATATIPQKSIASGNNIPCFEPQTIQTAVV
ncbi:hypothetical protein IVA87_26210 [Bradyrhizobium sp. 147]|nr:hypothetical protein [Bradyrhizobium sp. 147]